MKPSRGTPAHPSLVVAPRVLMVVDDEALREDIAEHLLQAGIRTAVASDGAELLARLADYPSLIILDLDIPQPDGFDLLRDIRRVSEAPLIIVASPDRESYDRIVAFELGADDYMTTPLDVRELLARIRTILRRRTARSTMAGQGRARFGPWELDHSTLRLQREGAPSIRLSKGEYALLQAFLSAPQRTLSREHLVRATQVHDDVFDRSIDVRIVRLRRKLEMSPGAPRIIETVRGVGYVFRAQVELL